MTRRGALTVASYPHEVVRFACDRCGRAGQYRRSTLLQRFGAAASMPDVLRRVSDCPRVGNASDPCGAQVCYGWTVKGGVVNYDLHGTPAAGGRESSYKSNRGVRSDEGVLTAGFDGTYGWFFRNRGSAPVTVRLRTTGPYDEIRRVM